jgi:DeoR/GlpR family transcriptional regulator of sugar metabolism
MTNAENRILVVDSTKFGLVKPVFFSDAAAYDHVCVDDTPIPDDLVPPAFAKIRVLKGDVGRPYPAFR